eukprot:7950858-Pyramimonas_sp.AAC.1
MGQVALRVRELADVERARVGVHAAIAEGDLPILTCRARSVKSKSADRRCRGGCREGDGGAGVREANRWCWAGEGLLPSMGSGAQDRPQNRQIRSYEIAAIVRDFAEGRSGECRRREVGMCTVGHRDLDSDVSSKCPEVRAREDALVLDVDVLDNRLDLSDAPVVRIVQEHAAIGAAASTVDAEGSRVVEGQTHEPCAASHVAVSISRFE